MIRGNNLSCTEGIFVFLTQQQKKKPKKTFSLQQNEHIKLRRCAISYHIISICCFKNIISFAKNGIITVEQNQNLYIHLSEQNVHFSKFLLELANLQLVIIVLKCWERQYFSTQKQRTE